MSADACLTLAIRGCVLHADLCVDSQRYIMGLNAKLDLWDHSDDTGYLGRINARMGFLPRGEWAVYADAHYFPAAGEGYPMLGVGRLWKPQSFVGAGYDFNAKTLRLQGQHAFSPLAYVSADIFTGDGFERLSEFALHYRVRDFYELQLVSNLDRGSLCGRGGQLLGQPVREEAEMFKLRELAELVGGNAQGQSRAGDYRLLQPG